MKVKKNTWFRNLIAAWIKSERRYLQWKNDPKNAEAAYFIEKQTNQFN